MLVCGSVIGWIWRSRWVRITDVLREARLSSTSDWLLSRLNRWKHIRAFYSMLIWVLIEVHFMILQAHPCNTNKCLFWELYSLLAMNTWNMLQTAVRWDSFLTIFDHRFLDPYLLQCFLLITCLIIEDNLWLAQGVMWFLSRLN